MRKHIKYVGILTEEAGLKNDYYTDLHLPFVSTNPSRNKNYAGKNILSTLNRRILSCQLSPQQLVFRGAGSGEGAALSAFPRPC